MPSSKDIQVGLLIPFTEEAVSCADHAVLRGHDTGDFLAYCDRELRVVWVNRTVADFAGTSAEDLVGRSCYEAFHGETEPCVGCRAEEVLSSGVPTSWTNEFSNGHVIVATAYPSFSGSETPAGVFIVGRDISEKHRAAVELERSRGTMESVFAAAPVGIGVAVGRVLQQVNEKLCTMTGYSREELLGSDVHVLYASYEEYRTVGEYKYRLLAEQGVCTIETRFRTRDGRPIDILMRSAAIDRTNLEAGVIFTALDITENKQTRKALEQAVQQKDILLREVHHRSKNNMQIISSLLNLEAERAGREEVSAPLRKMRARIRSMALVHEKLYRSDDLERVDLAEYTENLSSEVVSLHDGHLERIVEADSIPVDIDFAVPFGLILNELLTNSLKHGFDAGERGSVRISVHRENEFVYLRIRDDGRGVSEEFDVNSVASLGLQLVSALVQQLHGSVSAYPDGGTVWEVKLTDLAYLKENGPSKAAESTTGPDGGSR